MTCCENGPARYHAPKVLVFESCEEAMRLSEAVILFACIQGAAIALPELAPTAQSRVTAAKAKGDRLPVRSPDPDCASQTWPNLTQACLRNIEHQQGAE